MLVQRREEWTNACAWWWNARLTELLAELGFVVEVPVQQGVDAPTARKLRERLHFPEMDAADTPAVIGCRATFTLKTLHRSMQCFKQRPDLLDRRLLHDSD